MTKTTCLAVLAALALGTVAGRAEKLPPLPDGAFTYVVIPDTQLYRGEGAHVKKGKKPQAGPTRNPAFASRVDWIAANIEKERIAFVSHVGDIVDFRNAAQWAFASNQMAKLDGKVPYGISPGNHDIGGADTTEFNTWFPRARYETNAWYAGSFGGYVNAKGRKVCAGNADSCQLFEAGGMKFVVLHLECNAPAPVLAWVDEMLDKYADRSAIICTHMYLGYATKELDEIRRTSKERPDAWFGVMDWTKCHGKEGVSAAKAWETCFSKHRNLILIVSGDQSPAICWRVTQKGVYGNTVHATLQDYPRTADTEDWLRLYRFRPAERCIDVWTYSPQQDRVCDAAGFRTGRDWHVFTLPLQGRAHRSARFQVEMGDGGSFCRKVGETVSVNACVKGADGGAVNSGTVEAWVDDGWTNVVWRRSVDLAKEPVVKMSLSRSTPGTLRIHLSMEGVRERMDRVVFGQTEIMPLTPCPEDFESYWRGELAKLQREVPIAVEKTPASDLSTVEHDVFRVSFATFNGKRVYGFLAVPKGKGPFPVCVNVPGAGPGVVAPSRMRKGWINLTMNMHGFPAGRTKKEQKERYDAWLSDLWVRGGEPKYQRFGFAAGRDKPIYHDIVTGMVRALDWLADEPYADASRFVYCGCSQGGGFGIYLTALWGRFRKSLILCPNMCDMLAYKAGRQPGSEHILMQTPQHRPAAELTGPYYDACNFARLVRTSVRMVYGLSDDNCNTGGGIAAFNALGTSDKELRLLPGVGHGWHRAGFDTWLFDL